VLVAGGLTPTGATDTVEIYDPNTDTWSAGSRLESPRFHHGAISLGEGEAVLVAGGLSAPFGETVPAAEIYEVSKRAWRPAGALKQGRTAPTITTLSDGRALVAGGALHLGALSSTELYDPKLDAWVQGPSMSTERVGHAASRLSDGRVLLVGGETASVDLFDPRTGQIQPLARLGSDRTGHTLTATTDGRVVMVGGHGAGGSAAGHFAAVHLFDGAARTWGTADSLLGTPRRDHRATPLPSGQILVSGGRDQGGPLGSLELSRPYGTGALDGGILTDADGAGATDADGAGATDADGAGATDADSAAVPITFDGAVIAAQSEEGCACTVTPARPVGSWWLFVLLLLLHLRRRRR
jgi:MYXO-CTERM domain-containing protein